MQNFTVALAGNPNCGKTSIFNQLTKSHQHVGNWPGKTVEKKEGTFEHKGRKVTVVDLPGTYSLSAFSVEEIIARDFIMNEKPDAVIAVLDANNLERNLYLAVQILELGAKMVVDLNMSDLARFSGLEIDTKQLSSALQSGVVETVANKGTGLDRLKDEILATMD
jgi:ferrous iron transport protein B